MADVFTESGGAHVQSKHYVESDLECNCVVYYKSLNQDHGHLRGVFYKLYVLHS